MSEPEVDLLPTVTLQHRYGEQRLLANRADYIHEKDGRFRNWLLSNDDPEVQPPPCLSVPALTMTASSAPAVPPAPAILQEARRSGRRHRRGRLK